jgi:flagellar basal body L-ring protein FlgH
MRPTVKRDYKPQRYNRDDFVDSDSSGSLWANQGSSSELFTNTNDKRNGDVVIINVLDNLRNQISSELKRAFPDTPKKKPESGETPAAAANTASSTPTPGAPADDVDMKVYDKVSGTVIEEINKDYLIVRGRKEVIFKKEKRAIEIEALVSRRDILENDYVNSDKLLESRVFVLR